MTTESWQIVTEGQTRTAVVSYDTAGVAQVSREVLTALLGRAGFVRLEDDRQPESSSFGSKTGPECSAYREEA